MHEPSIFTYKIWRDRGGMSLRITHIESSKTKDFWLAGMKSPCRLELHMRHMPDSLILESWFEKRSRKGKK